MRDPRETWLAETHFGGTCVRRLRIVALFAVVCCLASPGRAECTVKEAQDHYAALVQDQDGDDDEELDFEDRRRIYRQIKKLCDYEIDTQSCTLKKVIQLIEVGHTMEEIMGRCMR